jgi:hypothetical protein
MSTFRSELASTCLECRCTIEIAIKEIRIFRKELKFQTAFKRHALPILCYLNFAFKELLLGLVNKSLIDLEVLVGRSGIFIYHHDRSSKDMA